MEESKKEESDRCPGDRCVTFLPDVLGCLSVEKSIDDPEGLIDS